MSEEHSIPIVPSSAPCYADDPQFRQLNALDDKSAVENVMRWRTNERARLIKLRQSVPAATRKLAAQLVALQLESLIEHRGDNLYRQSVLSFRGEPSLRG